MIDLIEKYTQLNGISGNEFLIKKEIRQAFLSLFDEETENKLEIIEDKLGSIALVVEPPKYDKTIGFFAHQDEVGLMVKNITKEGLVEVVNIGGININSLISQRVSFVNSKNEKYIGVVLSKSPHLGDNKLDSINDIKIHFGFNSKEDANKIGLKVGSYLNFIGTFEFLENENFIAKASDNRIGMAICEYISECLCNKTLNKKIIIGCSVQEEVGLRGINPLINSIGTEIDDCYIIDVSPIDDMEDYKLGDGPLLRVREPRTIYSQTLKNYLINIAEKHNIAYQLYFARGGTDGAALQINNNGNNVTALCVPALNLHTNSVLANMNDIKNIILFIKRIIEDE